VLAPERRVPPALSPSTGARGARATPRRKISPRHIVSRLGLLRSATWRAVNIGSLEMKSWFASVVIGIAALVLICQSANATPRRHRSEPGLTAASVAVGVGSTAGFFALRDWKLRGSGRVNGFTATGAAVVTTMGCLALSPIVGTVLIGRELTYREAYGLTADCIIPFIGSWLVDKAFDAHPGWDEGRPSGEPVASTRRTRPARRRPQ
jgi:hypothetical protein